jgi:hypothetical protein
MNFAVILVVVAVISLVVILRLAVARSLQVRRSAHLDTKIRPMDVNAFRNLINPAEDEFLRHRLPSRDYRRVRRARLGAMAAYVQIAAENAALLVGFGEAALASGDPKLTEAAQQLVNQALVLRRNSAVTLANIYVAMAWPYSGLATVRVIERYEQMSGSAMLLGRLQKPGEAVRLSRS